MKILTNFKFLLVLILIGFFSNNSFSQIVCNPASCTVSVGALISFTGPGGGVANQWDFDYTGGVVPCTGNIMNGPAGANYTASGTNVSTTYLTAGTYIVLYRRQEFGPPFTTHWCTQVTVTAPVPIELLSFNGKVRESFNDLHWSTTSETNNDYFILERSINGSDFVEIAKIDGAGNSNELINYSFIDNSPNHGINYYRLKQVDYDACFTYSHTISLNFIDRENNQLEILNISPNPSSDYINIVLNKNIDSYLIEIYDLSGSLVKTLYIEEMTSNIELNISELGQGIYSLKLISSEETLSKKFVKTETR